MEKRAAASDDEEETLSERNDAEDDKSEFSVSEDEDDVGKAAINLQQLDVKEGVSEPSTNLLVNALPQNRLSQGSATAEETASGSDKASENSHLEVAPAKGPAGSNDSAASGSDNSGPSVEASVDDGSIRSSDDSTHTNDASRSSSGDEGSSSTALSDEHNDGAEIQSQQGDSEPAWNQEAASDIVSNATDDISDLPDADEQPPPERPRRRAQVRKPLEPYEVPTAGAFFMHDDRFGGKEGKFSRQPQRRRPEWSPADDKWCHDKFESLLVPLTHEEPKHVSRNARRGESREGFRGRGRRGRLHQDAPGESQHGQTQTQSAPYNQGQGRGSRAGQNPGRGSGSRAGAYLAGSSQSHDVQRAHDQAAEPTAGRYYDAAARRSGRALTQHLEQREGRQGTRAPAQPQNRTEARPPPTAASPAQLDDGGGGGSSNGVPFRIASSGLRAGAQDYTPSPPPSGTNTGYAYYQSSLPQQLPPEPQPHHQQQQGISHPYAGEVSQGAEAHLQAPPPPPQYLPQLQQGYPPLQHSTAAFPPPALEYSQSAIRGAQQPRQPDGTESAYTTNSYLATSMPPLGPYNYALPPMATQYSQPSYSSGLGYEKGIPAPYAPPPSGAPQQQLARPVRRPIPIQPPPDADNQAAYNTGLTAEPQRVGGRRYSTMTASGR